MPRFACVLLVSMVSWACAPAAAEPEPLAPDGAAEPDPGSAQSADESAPGASGLAMPEDVRALWPQISATAQRHGLPPDLVALVVWLESGGRPEAVSPSGARGLMQLMPATAAAVARDRGEPPPSDEELSDPARNLELGCAHVAALLDELELRALDGEAVHRLAVAYNGGMAVLRAWDGGQPLPEETRAYAAAMRERWESRDAR
ncbi:transglycosylase SLT domain-containing protein [Paraliomyxa miuraensis]|nr:transglycosylase SLT domain-containing protein [Paraliomyxa miuraensis]